MRDSQRGLVSPGDNTPIGWSIRVEGRSSQVTPGTDASYAAVDTERKLV